MGRGYIPGIHGFWPGDVVRITAEFQHKMRIKEVVATFFLEEGTFSEFFTMTGVPGLYEDQGGMAELGAWRSYVNLEAEIPAEAVPGVYSLQLLSLTTYGGKTYSYEGEKLGSPIAAFEVVAEPEDPPVIEGSGHSKPDYRPPYS